MTRATMGSTGHGTAPAGRASRRAAGLFVCAECRYAQLFALQPRLLCTLPGAPLQDVVLFAGQPACPSMTPRRDAEPVMACCSPATQAQGSLIKSPGR